MNGEFLFERRKAIGISQNKLSSLLGYSNQLISLWESDKSFPSLDIWSRYASILELDLEGFLTGKIKKDNDYCNQKSFNKDEFAKNLRLLRTNNGISQRDLAKKISVNNKTISKWESGSSLPNYQQFLKLCELFKLTFDELYFSIKKDAVVIVKTKKKIKPVFILIPIIVVTAGSSAGVAVAISNINRRNDTSINNDNHDDTPDDDPHTDVPDGNNDVVNHDETYFYGDYPQTIVDDNDTIESLNSLSSLEDNGYYLYKNNYYQKAETHFSSNRYRSLSFNYFSNYSTISDNTTYWFKVEPIEWYVLSKSDNEYLLLSKLIIDSKNYDYPNSVNYKESNIRAYLNNEFYSKAFFKGDSKIIVSEVDNSLESTTMSFNPNTCENTSDKVFLPSVKDLSSAEYDLGLMINNEKTIAIASDYSRASLEMVFDDGVSSYWTRTPTKTSAGSYCSYSDGLETGDSLAICELGIRPMIKISI